MPSELHRKMVEACRRSTPAQLRDGSELNRLPYKNNPRRIPDLYLEDKLAIEVLTLPNNDGGLPKFGYTYRNLALTIPVPDNVTEIWLYDPAADAIVEKLHRNVGRLRVPHVELECFKCGYKWTPRLPKPPKMCPSCKSRDWNKRQPYGAYALQGGKSDT